MIDLSKMIKHLYKIFNFYDIISLVIGFFIFGWMVLFFMMFFLIISFDIYKKHHEKIGKDSMIGIVLFLSIFSFVFYNNIQKYSDIIHQKESLYQMQGIIPKKPTRVAIGRSHEYFLTLDNQHFSCGDDKKRDACQLIYEHYGKNATVYYQYADNHRHRAYEIVVGDKVVYSFREQVDYFTKKQVIAKRNFIYFFILYVVPLLVFIIMIQLHNHHIKRKTISHQELTEQEIDIWVGFSVLLAFGVVLMFGYYLLKF